MGCEAFENGIRIAPHLHGKQRARVVPLHADRFLNQKFVVLADHAGPVFAARTPFGKLREENVVGRILGTGRALRLVEFIGVQLGHVTVEKVLAHLTGRRVLPRVVTVVCEMLFEDALLNLRRVFGQLDGHAFDDLLAFEQVRERLDKVVELQV